MVYTLTTTQWDQKIEEQFNGEIKGYCKPKPIPMRPILDRIHAQTRHFVVMEGNTTACSTKRRRGKRLALIELAEPKVLPTRIDKRLKSIRQIIATREVINLNHPKGIFIWGRFKNELHDLMTKCERLWPCHFMIKGIDYVRPKTFMDG